MPRHIFSSESVTEGHPDKVCDTISDYVLDACLDQDSKSRVACETLAKGNLIVLAGEITSNAHFDFIALARKAVRDIGYTNQDCCFHADTCRIICEMTEQSRDIKQGVDEAAAEGKGTAEQGAAAEAHAERAPGFAVGDVEAQDAGPVLALERDEMPAGIEHRDRKSVV